MSAQDNIEKVLREMHVLLSKSQPVQNQPGKVLVEKQKVLDMLAELNTCIYAIMDEYELTERSRDKAEREFRKKGDQIIWDASRKAEDIYAASVMYTEEALNHLKEMMQETNEQMEQICRAFSTGLESEQKRVQTNQLELKSSLQDLRDTEKYLRLIEDRNEEIRKEKRVAGKKRSPEASIYANRRTEIKVNTEALERLGLLEEETEEELQEAENEVERENPPENSVLNQSMDDLEFEEVEVPELEIDRRDRDLYEGKESFSNLTEAMASKEKKNDSGIGKMWKGLTGKL